ncbi:MAG: L-aspartate oxidase [Phycisphaerales bacterium]
MDPLFDERRYLIPFRSGLLPQIFTDTLVIGAGVAGASAAIEAARHGEVIVLAKGPVASSNTAWAQGGVAGVLRDGDRPASGADDTPDAHLADTLTAGAGLCDHAIASLIVDDADRALRQLIDLGMRFDRDARGHPAPGLEGGHSAPRIYHHAGDSTGAEMQRCLAAAMSGVPSIRVFENCFALDLLTPSDEPGSPVLGAITYHARYGLQMLWARTTILASGGAGMLYRETTNPRVATADGIAMAYRAGATLGDMAFVQFHPTTLYLPGATRTLISEAVRGEGALLLDAGGRRFMPDVHPQAELAPRDVVSQAIMRQIAKQGGRHVWLDCRAIDAFDSRFPAIGAMLRRFELDPASDLIPVHPAAHYMIGGVRTDAATRTDVPGLLAVGEAACSGLHGANRLASNSLLEGLVLGRVAGEQAGQALASGTPRPGPTSIVSDIRPSDHAEIDLPDVRSSLRSAMWRNVGLERAGPRLRDAADMFDFWARYTLDKIFDHPEGWEVQNLLLVAALVTRAATWREESRGTHARSDFPAPSDAFRVHDLWRRGREQGEAQAVDSGEATRPSAG